MIEAIGNGGRIAAVDAVVPLKYMLGYDGQRQTLLPACPALGLMG